MQVETIVNKQREDEYNLTCKKIADINEGQVNEVELYHGSIYAQDIVDNGYNVKLANKKAMLGPGKSGLFKAKFGNPLKCYENCSLKHLHLYLNLLISSNYFT